MAAIISSATVRARVKKSLKDEVETILGELHLTISDAINLFMAQIKLKKGIPFDVRVPNKKTLKTFKDTDAGRNLIRCSDAQDMFKKLGI